MSATRTGSTARASGSRSRSRRSSASTRSARSRSTGSPSSRERCKERVANYVGVITRAVQAARHVDGLGQRLPHLLDTNIEYIWRFLKECHRARLALQGPPLDAVVPALRHLALAARAGRRGELPRDRAPVALRPLPAQGRDGESLVIWTTTPWTLPANVAAAVKPDAEYGLDARRRVASRASSPAT